MRLSRETMVIDLLLSAKVVRGGVERAPTIAPSDCWSPATYQIAMLPLQHRTVGKAGVESAVSCSQGTRGAVPLPPGRFVFASIARMGVEPISPP
jgi:hypothetical protein